MMRFQVKLESELLIGYVSSRVINLQHNLKLESHVVEIILELLVFVTVIVLQIFHMQLSVNKGRCRKILKWLQEDTLVKFLVR